MRIYPFETMTLLPEFGSHDLRVFLRSDPLRSALELMDEMDYSQVPVLTDWGYRLITSNGLNRWFLHHPAPELAAATIADILQMELPDTCLVLDGGRCVADAFRAFADQPPLSAVLVTQDPQGPPVGMVTPWDLTEIVVCIDD